MSTAPSSLEPGWYQAVTLTERLATLRAFNNGAADHKVNTALAERRLERWRSQTPFADDEPFSQRLGLDQLTVDEFLHLLGESVEDIPKRLPRTPAWLDEIVQSFSTPEPGGDEAAQAVPTLLSREVSFLGVTEPLISRSLRRLHEGVEALRHEHADLPFDPANVEALLFDNLPRQLAVLLSRTLTLELNVARLRGQLEGETPEERFRHFLTQLRERDVALSTLLEYPVLARQLVIHINSWLNFSLEFLRHLCADWDALRETMSPGVEPGVLTRVEVGAGDSHRGGRSVVIAEFGNGFRLVYKPKSMAVDTHLQELLGWLNERGDHPPFRTMRIIDRGHYGWSEFIPADSCGTAEGLERFYERQGGYLALLYALEATDFHFENLIASGEHPVLIDLESLFHPRTQGIDVTQPDLVANNSMVYSVLRVGLLPQRIWLGAGEDGIDLSGIGATGGQLTPHSVPTWEATGTDEMRMVRKRVEMPGGVNRPSLNGSEVNPLDYSSSFVKGFTSLYRLLVKHRAELLADDGPMARFAADEVRFIVRPTRTYSLLLNESFHPDVLRNALDRDRFFDRLWVGIESRPYLDRVIASERHDLQHGDVPMFTTRPDSRDIWSSTGERITDFLDEPGLELVQKRLRQLSDEDLERQLWFINASLASLSMGDNQGQWASYPLVRPSAEAGRDDLLATACAVGDRLEALALRSEESVSWIGVSLVNERHWMLLPLGTDLYNGLPGVALFLGYLGALSGQERYTALARATLASIRRRNQQIQSSLQSIGGFDGWGGHIYLLTHLGVLWREPALLEEAQAAVERLPELIARDEYLDIISGSAGCIGSLLGLYRVAPEPRTLEAARLCGERLLEKAQLMPRGIGWQTPVTGEHPLAGFSHGGAGIGWALYELAAATGEERFRAAAVNALDYERSLFVPEAGNWPDLREMEAARAVKPERDEASGAPKFMLAWCHGAPGIGLARALILKHTDDPVVREELRVALRSTLAAGFGRNHSLCHGDLGNLELLLQAGQRLDDPELAAKAKNLSSIVLQSVKEHGWICGIPLGVETPSLMTGLAGIGYGLLRLAEPGRVPSVLTLEPPPLDPTNPHESTPR